MWLALTVTLLKTYILVYLCQSKSDWDTLFFLLCIHLMFHNHLLLSLNVFSFWQVIVLEVLGFNLEPCSFWAIIRPLSHSIVNPTFSHLPDHLYPAVSSALISLPTPVMNPVYFPGLGSDSRICTHIRGLGAKNLWWERMCDIHLSRWTTSLNMIFSSDIHS